MRTADTVRIEMIHGDALTTAADVLALKYAQAYHGVDRLVASRLAAVHGDALDIAPDRGEFRLVPSRGAVRAKDILFLGVAKLYAFGYREIREFSRDAMSRLAVAAPDIRVLAMTLHGPANGLDEQECFLSLMA